MIIALVRAEAAYFHLEPSWKFYREMAAIRGTGYGVPVKEPDNYPIMKMSLPHDIIRSRRLKAHFVT
jgi:hypothetical protein